VVGIGREAVPVGGPKNGPPVSARGNRGSAGRTIARADHRGRRCPYSFFRGRDRIVNLFSQSQVSRRLWIWETALCGCGLWTQYKD
jgi:hypothetical protein